MANTLYQNRGQNVEIWEVLYRTPSGWVVAESGDVYWHEGGFLGGPGLYRVYRPTVQINYFGTQSLNLVDILVSAGHGSIMDVDALYYINLYRDVISPYSPSLNTPALNLVGPTSGSTIFLSAVAGSDPYRIVYGGDGAGGNGEQIYANSGSHTVTQQASPDGENGGPAIRVSCNIELYGDFSAGAHLYVVGGAPGAGGGGSGAFWDPVSGTYDLYIAGGGGGGAGTIRLVDEGNITISGDDNGVGEIISYPDDYSAPGRNTYYGSGTDGGNTVGGSGGRGYNSATGYDIRGGDGGDGIMIDIARLALDNSVTATSGAQANLVLGPSDRVGTYLGSGGAGGVQGYAIEQTVSGLSVVRSAASISGNIGVP